MQLFPKRDKKIAELKAACSQLRREKKQAEAERDNISASLGAKVEDLEIRVRELEQIESDLRLESERNLNAFQLSEQNVELQAHIIAGYIETRRNETLAMNAAQSVLQNGVKNGPDEPGIDSSERW